MISLPDNHFITIIKGNNLTLFSENYLIFFIGKMEKVVLFLGILIRIIFVSFMDLRIEKKSLNLPEGSESRFRKVFM